MHESQKLSQKRDASDLETFICWLKTQNSFDRMFQTRLMSKSSGTLANETMNCAKADDLSSVLEKEMIRKNCAELSMKHSGKVLPLAALSSAIK